MHSVFYDTLQVGSLNILAMSNNVFFGNAAIVDSMLDSSQYVLLALFVYLKVFMVYQFCCLFQWAYMLVLNRTYREANQTERYTRLYLIGKANDGSYKTMEIRLMEKGLIGAIAHGIKNTLAYFFV